MRCCLLPPRPGALHLLPLPAPQAGHHCHLRNPVTLGKLLFLKHWPSVAAHDRLLTHRDWCEALWSVFVVRGGLLQIREETGNSSVSEALQKKGF